MRNLYLIALSLLTVFAIRLEAQPCQIATVDATPLACSGFVFDVQVDLTVENPASDSFTLAGNGTLYGSWPYSSLPVTVGPFTGDAGTLLTFIAWDIADSTCQAFDTLTSVDCGPICDYTEAELTLVSCLSNSLALVEFDMEYAHNPGAAFNLFYEDGTQIGSWLYTSLPIVIPAFEVNGAAPITLTMCDQTNPDCCETFVLDALDCDPTNCELFSPLVDPECTGSNFLVHLDFEYTNPASDSFTVMGNGLDFGTFAYADLPVTMGPLNGSSNIPWEFVIADAVNPDCQVVEILGVYQCPPPCDVLSLIAEAQLCNGNEAYSLALEVDIEGEGDHGLSVFSHNTYYGTYSYADLPLTLPAYAGSGEFYDVVTVCDAETPGCCATATFEALLCAGCLIYNLTTTPLPCNAEDQIYVEIDFDYQNVSNLGFEITGNGTNYGQFDYGELPVLLGPFPGDGSQFFEFVVTDLEDPFCFEAVELGLLECGDICELTELTAETGDCSGNGTYSVMIDFEYQGVTGIGFDLYANGEHVGFYSYNELPLTILEFPSGGTGLDTITVCENDNPACCATLVYEAPVCACEIFETTAMTLVCTSDTTFSVSVEFFSENMPSTFVDVFLDGVFLGFFNAAELPLIINNVPEGTGQGVLTICANDLSSCCDEVLIDLMECDGPQCQLGNLLAEAGDCNSDSTYLLDIVFSAEHLPNDSVDISANGEFIGRYEVDPDFIRIEQFPTFETDTIELIVCAAGDSTCCDTYVYVAPDCSLFNQCLIVDLAADPGGCTSDSTYVLDITFGFEHLPGDFVVISANGQEIGTRIVNGGMINFTDFPALPGNLIELTVCALGDSSCCATTLFEEPGCLGPEPCGIWDLVAEAGDCLTDSTYVLFVDFNFVEVPGNQIVVSANGEPVDTLSTGDGSFPIEHFPVVGTQQTILTICALGNPDCCDVFEFETPDCSGTDPCNIFELTADPGDCTSDTTYSLFIQYAASGFPGDSIVVRAGGEVVGHYLHQPAGFTIENFPALATPFTAVRVCALEAPECCDIIEIPTPDCGQGLPCDLFELTADTGECTSDSTYSLFIQYGAVGFPGDSISVFANGELVGQYPHEPDGFTIENFPALTTLFTALQVCAVDAPDCCAVIEFETPDCGQGLPCDLFELAADTGACTSDSTYSLFIQYLASGFPGDSISVFANGELVGRYLHQPDGFTIENFPALTTLFTALQVCAVDAPDCCAVIEFETPDCGQGLPCQLFDLVADTDTCTSDTTYSLLILYETNHFPGDSIIVRANGELVGHYLHQPDGFTIENFPALLSTNTVLTVCALEAPECCDVFEFATPDCGQGLPCQITELLVETGDCTSDTTFLVDIVFTFSQLPVDSVLVYADGILVGQYEVPQTFLRIENFPHLPGEETTITVCAVGDPECCDTYVVETPFCTSDCVIYNMSAEVFDCNSDSTFAVVIDFNWQNIEADGFDITIGEDYYGFFTFDQIPLEIGQFPTNPIGAYTITVCESDNPECCSTLTFGGPTCENTDCAITELTFEMTECNEEDQFFFILDFEAVNFGPLGFSIVGNGNEYGTFDYGTQPIELGPFTADGTAYEFVVRDNADPECQAVIVPGAVECITSVSEPVAGEFFEVFNNGTAPWIHARQPLQVTMYRMDGTCIDNTQTVTASGSYSLNPFPDGMYVAIVSSGAYRWPVKLVRMSR